MRRKYRAVYIITDLNVAFDATSIKSTIRRDVPDLKAATLFDFTSEMLSDVLSRGFQNPQIEFSHYYAIGPKPKRHPFRKGVFL